MLEICTIKHNTHGSVWFSYLESKVRIGVCCLFSSLFAQLIHMTAAAASAATAASLLMGAGGVQEHQRSAPAQHASTCWQARPLFICKPVVTPSSVCTTRFDFLVTPPPCYVVVVLFRVVFFKCKIRLTMGDNKHKYC